ncbi:hypothetical protein GGS23DRAFT_216878 [Durotheca rogersii]|uniref:uncharacterized protein n=1 Tax=Durotheca rogersii TaxID=419775 RepID=UPI002220D625|nr:uncharacterized protein GGS23DRAFT_216878 [Durotheca rogersii]KAI5860919.1 hypothetical protein GGS23DRAFT_216878 [Durotheca rogersii]
MKREREKSSNPTYQTPFNSRRPREPSRLSHFPSLLTAFSSQLLLLTTMWLSPVMYVCMRYTEAFLGSLGGGRRRRRRQRASSKPPLPAYVGSFGFDEVIVWVIITHIHRDGMNRMGTGQYVLARSAPVACFYCPTNYIRLLLIQDVSSRRG